MEIGESESQIVAWRRVVLREKEVQKDLVSVRQIALKAGVTYDGWET